MYHPIQWTNSYFREAAYKDMKINKPICDSYVSAMNAMGHSTIFDAAGQEGGLSGGSTDMGKFGFHFLMARR